MEEKKRYNIKKIIIASCWIVIGMGVVVLLVAAMNRKTHKTCAKVNITITGVQNNFFIDKKDVQTILKTIRGGELKGAPVNSFNLSEMEAALQKNDWVKHAELFFDNNEVLNVEVAEREPVARVFTVSGNSFYIDSAIEKLPLSDKFSARLPVFTDFPSDRVKPSRGDSVLLYAIRNMSEYIYHDPFWMAQVEQVDITPARNFEIIPKLGNNIIVFGDATDYDLKFRKLLVFYQDILTKEGWSKYARINVAYKDQVIGELRGKGEKPLDSLKAAAMMQDMVLNSQRSLNDTTSVQLVQPAEDNTPPSAPQIDALPEEQTGSVPSIKINNNINPATSNIPPKPITKSPLPVATGHSPGVVKPPPSKGAATVIKKPIIQGKSNVSPAKKPVIVKSKSNKVKPPPVKPVDKLKPKAVMPPKNDY